MLEYTYNDLREAIKILKLLSYSDNKDLKRKYKEISKQTHPDAGGSAEEFAKLQRAYEIVKDYIENYKYDFSKEEYYKQNPQEKIVEQFKPQ